MSWISRILSSDLAIDLDGKMAMVYRRGKGIVVEMPTLVAIDKITGAVRALGFEAREAAALRSDRIKVVEAIRAGVIVDLNLARRFFVRVIQQAHRRTVYLHPRIVIGISGISTLVERRALVDSCLGAGASEVFVIERGFFAAIGAGLPVTELAGNMIVDIGSSTTEVAVISYSAILCSRTSRVGCDHMDEAIVDYMKLKYNLLIAPKAAAKARTVLGSAFPLQEPRTMRIKGRNLIEGIPKEVTIDDADIREALSGCVISIVEAIQRVLEGASPELSEDISERGIVLTGSGSLLMHLDWRIRKETGLPVSHAEDPEASLILGMGSMLNDFRLVEKLAFDSKVGANSI